MWQKCTWVLVQERPCEVEALSPDQVMQEVDEVVVYFQVRELHFGCVNEIEISSQVNRTAVFKSSHDGILGSQVHYDPEGPNSK